MLDAQLEDKKSELTVMQKWSINFKIQTSPDLSEDVKQKFEQRMTAFDDSDLSVHHKLRTEAALANLESRDKLWSKFTKTTELSFEELEISLEGFFAMVVKDELKLPFYQKFFEILPEFAKENSNEYARSFIQCAVPEIEEEPEVIEKLIGVCGKIDPKFEYVLVKIQMIIEDLKKTKKILALFN